MKTSKIRWCAILLAISAVLALACWWCWPPSEERVGKSLAIVRHTVCYTLEADGCQQRVVECDTLYTPAAWINRWLLLPSCRGLLAAPYVQLTDTLTTYTPEQVRQWVEKRRQDLGQQMAGRQREAANLAYYLKVHGVQDEGYHEIADYARHVTNCLDSLHVIDSMLGKALLASRVAIRRQDRYEVVYDEGDKQVYRVCTLQGVSSDSSYVWLRVHPEALPMGVVALSMWPWADSIPRRLLFTRFGDKARLALRIPQISNRLVFCSPGHDSLPLRHTGYWICYRQDTVAYAGMWKNGLREGRGVATDSVGHMFQGLFVADTLVYGVRTDGRGVYRGAMDCHGRAMGHGTLTDSLGNRYEGKWTADRRNGFGYAIGPQTWLRAGEWQDDTYRGERMTYHSERIYGIDVSRFQHEIGRKRYAIHWNRLRITHLGTLSRKTVSGKVDYPVSFAYIKSTEGISVRNKYYAADYRMARKAGIHTGSYHFFSTTSAADAQARHFVKHTSFSKGDLPPVLDVEPSDAQIRKMGGPEVLWKHVGVWLSMVEKHCGVRPVLYISQTFVNRYLPLAPDIRQHYRVWIARYGEYKPDIRLTYWQLSPDGKVDGITGDVDINVFNGFHNAFEEFLEQECIP